jgi:integrase
MPRPRPPHLHRQITRHGKAVWYVRQDHGPRIRIRAEFGTPEFDTEYRAALAGAPTRKAAPSCSTLEWLLARYRETTAWSDLSAATRDQRDNIFAGVIETAGQEPYVRITTATIEAGKERRAHTPHQARNFLDAMRGLFRWAYKAKLVKVDPTAGVSNPPRKQGEGFKVWAEEDVTAYEARWPLGTRQRVWLDVLLYTGLRRGDAVRIGRQHVRNGVATLKNEKGGFTVEVNLPILPVLQRTLDAGPCGDLAFICGERGHPLTKESFGNLFKDACKDAGVNAPKQAAHGLRKVAATRAAENGATEFELMAIFGWNDPKMAALYVKAANRKRLAAQAMQKLNVSGTSIPSPDYPVREKVEKAQ